MKKLNQHRALVLSSVAMVLAAGLLHFTAVAAMAQPAQLNKVEIKPTPVEGGQPIEVIIRLTKKGNMWVKLNSSNNNIIPVQANMPVQLKDVSSKSIHLDTNIITGSSQFVTIKVSAGAVQRSASVSVKPQGATGGGTGGAYSIYKIKGSMLGELRTLAQSNGWTFTTKLEKPTGPDSEYCGLNTGARGITLNIISSALLCSYELFGGSRRLNTGWTLDKLVWSLLPTPPPRIVSQIRSLYFYYGENPKFGTDNLYFKVFQEQDNFFGTIRSQHLLEIWLKGPQGATWQEAFQYVLLPGGNDSNGL